jgi:hypothetical protein
MPFSRILDLVQDKLAGSEWVEELETDGSYHGADEGLPHCFIREIVGKLLYAGKLVDKVRKEAVGILPPN